MATVFYKPNIEYLKYWSDVSSNLDMIIFNNGCDQFNLGDFFNNNYILGTGENVGLGAAFNKIIKFAREHSYTHFIYFDQDTSIDNKILKNLYDFLRNEDLQNFALVGPKYHSMPPKNPTQMIIEKNVKTSWIISSGSIHNLSLIPANIKYKEDYFIDRLDFEICWQLSQLGYDIGLLEGYSINHSIGEINKNWVGLVTRNHSAIRHFYMSRNRVLFYLRDYKKIYLTGLLILILSSIKHLVILNLEKNAFQKFSMALKGFISGVKSIKK